MRSLKTVLSSVLLGLLGTATLAGCSEPPPTSGELAPFRGEWETVAAYPLGADGVDGLTDITIGGTEAANNYANRGNVEVYYTAPQVEIPGLGMVDQVIVQMREFTFAASQEDAQADFDQLKPWMYPTASVAPPSDFEPGDECNPRDPETGALALDGECVDSGAACLYDSDCGGAAGSCGASGLLGWADGCTVRVYWEGQNQKLRAGADIRVFLPPAFEGRLNIVTEDNLQEAQDYPDLNDVTVVGLAGTAFIEADAARVKVRLADNIEPVPACPAELNQECLDAGWGPMEICATSCTDFGRVDVKPRGQQPIEVMVDAPADLWMTAKLSNTLPGLTNAGDCKANVGGEIPENGGTTCGDFGACECLDCDAAKPFLRRVEINKPGPDSISGLGYSVDVESGDCTEKEFVDGPDDFTEPKSELRGNLNLCSGCLADITVPAP